MLLYENKIPCLKNIELDYEKEKDKIFCLILFIKYNNEHII